MESLSIQEVLTLWELQSVSVVTAQNVSNVLIALYAITTINIKNGCFFTAFFLDEILSNVNVLDALSEWQYSLVIAVIYCCLFWYAESKNMKFKTIIACGIMVLFNAGMMFDAIINKETHSFLYENYLLIVVFVHLYLISTLFKWKRIGRGLGAFFRVFSSSIRSNYNLAFICYTVYKKN
jgi:hypothetical protein